MRRIKSALYALMLVGGTTFFVGGCDLVDKLGDLGNWYINQTFQGMTWWQAVLSMLGVSL